ncbi:amino acid transporter [Sarocladium strictum]
MASLHDDRTTSTADGTVQPIGSKSDVHLTQHSSVVINASGHVQELKESFSLLSLAGLGLVVGNVWPAVGGSILVAVFNGGPPGLLYEFIAVSVFYWFIATSIAELASAIPSSSGVYQWASITPGQKWGRPLGFFAGWWNYLAWVLGCASMSSILANTLVQMYAQSHQEFVAKPWHTFVTYLITTWIACIAVCFGHSAMPALNKIGVFLILGGFIVTVITITVMPDQHASSSFVWKDWQADLGYPDGFVFVAGMLNGAYSVGAVDATTHLAEEISNPQRNVPLAILLQVSIGFVTGLCYLISLMYSINDYDALFTSPYPIAEIYRQATGSAAGAIGLLSLIMLCIALTVTGLYITAGRTLWTLARDGATPFPGFLGHVDTRFHVPLGSTIVTAVLVSVLGAIYVGNTTAFNNFVGSFILLSTSSFLACLLPHLLTGRKNIKFGPFRMKGAIGFIVNGVACVYIVVWDVIYCFPAVLPTTAESMNYTSVIWGGLTVLVSSWWFFGARRGYVGPPNLSL